MVYLVNQDGTDTWFMYRNIGQARSRVTRLSRVWRNSRYERAFPGEKGYIPCTIYEIYELTTEQNGKQMILRPVDLGMSPAERRKLAAEKKKAKAREMSEKAANELMAELVGLREAMSALGEVMSA
jgi:hypothetical protein